MKKNSLLTNSVHLHKNLTDIFADANHRIKIMKISNKINIEIISAIVGMLKPFVPDISPTRLLAALEDYDSSKNLIDKRPQKAYTVAEAMTILGVSKPCIYKMFKDGTLTKLKIRRATRIPASEINALITGS
jgi:excisionase family DNA binding protein